jgi:hypothetical protein
MAARPPSRAGEAVAQTPDEPAGSFVRVGYDHGPLTDYGARRAAFRELPTLSSADWHAICRAAGVPPGRGPRRLAASAWIWSAVTGGDWRSAPSTPNTERFRKAYRDFEANLQAQVESGLSACAESLLRNLEQVRALHGTATHSHEAFADRSVATASYDKTARIWEANPS